MSHTKDKTKSPAFSLFFSNGLSVLGAGASGAGALITRGCCTAGFAGEVLKWKGLELSFKAFTWNK